jgi:hypothetical protein
MAMIRLSQSDAAAPLQALLRCDKLTARHHRFVNGFIMLPNCGQAHAKLEWE